MRKKFLTAISAVFVLCACVGAAWADVDYNYFIPVHVGDPSAKGDPSARSSDLHYMRYQMDDVYGISGSGGQWIAVLASGDRVPGYLGGTTDTIHTIRATRGGRIAALPIKVEGNQLSFNNNAAYSYNGWRTVTNRKATSPVDTGTYESDADNHWRMPVRHFFMVIPNNTEHLWVDYRWRNDSEHYHWNNDGKDPNNGEAVDPDVRLGDDGYYADKTPDKNPIQSDTISRTNRFRLDLAKTTDDQRFSTLRTYLSFLQNPNTTPSQTLNIPIVIANVAMGDASVQPLEFTAVLRDDKGSLVASHHFNWNVASNTVINVNETSNGWVFLQQDDPAYESTKSKDYDITVDIRNYCGLRYALQRYDQHPSTKPGTVDGSDVTLMPVKKYMMDLPAGVEDVDPDIVLNPLSHIAPGLITRYDIRKFRINSTEQKILRLYPADGISSYSSPRDLSLRFESLGGVPLGTSGAVDVDRGSVLPFWYAYHNTNFLKADATIKVLKLDQPLSPDVRLNLAMPTSSDFTSGIKGITTGFANADQVASAYINIDQPGSLSRYSTTDTVQTADIIDQTVGLLPVLVTFHVERGHKWLNETLWKQFLQQWRTNGDIKDLFRYHYHLFAKADDMAQASDPRYRDFDITNFMINEVTAQRVNNGPIVSDRKKMYNNCVKVILDEEKGRITVSFIAMLTDSLKTSYGVLNDSTATGERNFLAVLDGNANNKWDMTFYLKRVSTTDINDNQNNSQYGGGGYISGGSGGGGGCSTGAAALLAICGAAAVCLRSKKGR